MANRAKRNKETLAVRIATDRRLNARESDIREIECAAALIRSRGRAVWIALRNAIDRLEANDYK